MFLLLSLLTEGEKGMSVSAECLSGLVLRQVKIKTHGKGEIFKNRTIFWSSYHESALLLFLHYFLATFPVTFKPLLIRKAAFGWKQLPPTLYFGNKG